MFVAIDNFEHFISERKLYDGDLVEILKILHGLPYKLQSRWNKIFSFSKHFAFIIVMRETTSKMLGEFLNERDVTIGWSHVDFGGDAEIADILEKKFQFIRKHFDSPEFEDLITYLENNKLNYVSIDGIQKGLLKTIFSDRVGSYTSLERMYSGNKRRIVEYALSAFNNRLVDIDAYIYFAEQANSVSYSSGYSIYRNAARQIVVRVFLDQIVNSKATNNFFDAISAIDGKMSIARRTLTCLRSAGDEVVGFKYLLETLFESPVNHQAASDNDIADLAKVLCALADESRKYCWAPLVHIIANDSTKSYTFSEQGLLVEDSLKDLLTDINNYSAKEKNKSYLFDEKNFSIYLTPSGNEFLSSIIPTFEYYAAKYTLHGTRKFSQKRPLFSYFYDYFILNNAPTNELNIWTSMILEHIGSIKDHVFERTREVAQNSRKFVRVNTNPVRHDYNRLYDPSGKYFFKSDYNTLLPHPQRVLDSHIQYIDNFRRLVLIECERKKLLDDGFMRLKIHRFSLDMLEIIREYIIELKKYATDKHYKSGITGAYPKQRHYYFGGPDRARKSSCDYTALGKKYYDPFMQTYLVAKKDPLNWHNAIEKKRFD